MAETMISPGVYTNIIDLSSYLTSTSGTIGFLPIITEKGEDNVLTRITSFQEYVEKFGEPDIRTFGKYYGCGPYVATQHLSVSSDLYVIRALPDDATYSHAFIYFAQSENYPSKYKFDVNYRRYTKKTAKQANLKYSGTHTSLSCFSVEPNIPYGLQSEIKCYQHVTEEKPAYTIKSDKKTAAIADKSAYTQFGFLTENEDKVVLTSNEEFANVYYRVLEEDYPPDATDEEMTAIDVANNNRKIACCTAEKGFDKTFKPISKEAATVVMTTNCVYTSDKTYAEFTPDSEHTVPSKVEDHEGFYEIAPEKIEAAKAANKAYDVDFVKITEESAAVAAYTDDVAYAKMVPGKKYEPIYNTTVCHTPKYAEVTGYLCTNATNKEEALRTHCAFDASGNLTADVEKVACTTDEFLADMDKDSNPIVYKGPKCKAPVLSKVKKTFTLAKENIQDAIANFAAFDEEGYPIYSYPTDEKKQKGLPVPVLTTIEEFAKIGYAPKMSNTQLLDSLFYGNDTLTVAAIDNCGSQEIYTATNVNPHDCVLAYVRAIGRGKYYDRLSIKITSDANPASFGTYKFQLFELQDGAEALCESYNVSFDPTALDSDGETMYFADVINKFSSRIRVEANESALQIMKKELHGFYDNDPTIKEITEDYVRGGDDDPEYSDKLIGFAPIPYYDTDQYSETYGKVVEPSTKDYVMGYKGQAIWNAYYNKAWADYITAAATEQYEAALAMDDNDENKEDAIDAAIDYLTVSEDMRADAEASLTWATSLNLMNMSDSDPITIGEQPFYLANGSLGSLINNKGVVNAAVGNQILCKAYTGLLKNPNTVKKVDESTGTITYSTKYTDNVYDLDWIYFTLVYDPGYKSDVKAAALNLVDTYRRDCVLISDCGDNSNYVDCLKYVGAIEGGSDVRPWNTYLAARYEPYSRVYDSYTGKDIWVSPVYHMAKLIPQSDALYDIWYAAAGFKRGTVSDIKELRYSCNKAQRDLFYQAQVNPIVHFPEGMTVWGQLTTQKANSTLSDLNCVRTVLYIKRAIEQYCKNFIFDLNDSTTWDSIKAGITPMLDAIVARRGLRSYTVEVSATEYELKTKVCHVNVMLVPMKVLEKIELNMYIQ